MGGEGEQAREEEPETDTSQPRRLHVREGPFRPTDPEGSKERCPAIGDALLLSKFRRYIPIRRDAKFQSKILDTCSTMFDSLFLSLSLSRSIFLANTGKHYWTISYDLLLSISSWFLLFFQSRLFQFAAIFLNHDQNDWIEKCVYTDGRLKGEGGKRRKERERKIREKRSSKKFANVATMYSFLLYNVFCFFGKTFEKRLRKSGKKEKGGENAFFSSSRLLFIDGGASRRREKRSAREKKKEKKRNARGKLHPYS